MLEKVTTATTSSSEVRGGAFLEKEPIDRFQRLGQLDPSCS